MVGQKPLGGVRNQDRVADIGIAGGDGYGIIFKKGKVFKKVEEENLVTELINEINIMTSEVQK